MHSARAEALFLEVDETNVPAIGLYRRLGFHGVGRRPAYYDHEAGREIRRACHAPRSSLAGSFGNRLRKRTMIGRIRTGLALLLVAGVTIPLGPVQWLAIRTGFPRPSLVPRLWHRVASRALGMRVRVTGRIADLPPLLVSNHVSWIDIVAIGAAAEVPFIAKSEMAGWPVAGWLARMQRTVFVERERRRKSGEQANEIRSRAPDGDVMVLFAEGTTATATPSCLSRAHCSARQRWR